jgi:hypothetical protein
MTDTNELEYCRIAKIANQVVIQERVRMSLKKIILFLFLALSVGQCSAKEWNFIGKSDRRLVIRVEEESIIIKCDPKTLMMLPDDIRDKFEKDGERSRYRYPKWGFWRKLLDQILQLIFSDEDDSQIGEYPLYWQRQQITEVWHPEEISDDKIAKIISTKNVLYYTGPGISERYVPTIPDLEMSLGISQKLHNPDNWPKYITDLVNKSGYYFELVLKFFDDGKKAKPTRTHLTLARLVKRYGHLLATENLDKLQQKTGVRPIVQPERKFCRDRLKGKIRDIPYILVIGLNENPGGFLRWCKQHNPQIVIISVTESNLKYLSRIYQE